MSTDNIISLPKPTPAKVAGDVVAIDRETLRTVLRLIIDLVAARQQFPRDDLLVMVSHLCCLLSDLISERGEP
jgi:hypothetical protein